MQAIFWDSDISSLDLTNRNIPDNPDPENIVIRVTYSGICGTDLHIMEKVIHAADKVILGHEFTGIVHSVGSSVTSLTIGDRVAVQPNSHCGKCRLCQKDRTNLCKIGLEKLRGIFDNGGWAEYCEVPEISAYKLPDDLEFKYAVFAEPTACVLNGFTRLANISSDSRILIMGTGIAGMLYATMCHHHGCTDVTLLGRDPIRMGVAAKMNLGYRLCTLPELEAQMADCDPDEDGFDFIIDCTGSLDCIEKAVEYVRKGGILNIYGGCPRNRKIMIDPSKLLYKEGTVTTTFLSTKSFRSAIMFINEVKDKYFTYEKLSAKEFPLNQYKEAIDTLKTKAVGKVVFKIADET